MVVKWPGSVHDSTIFLNSSINRKLRNRECEKVLVEGRDVITIYLIGDPAYPLFPFIMKEYPGRGEKQRENISTTNDQVPELPLRVHLAGWKLSSDFSIVPWILI